MAKHFTLKYNPWDQRLCLIPNGDLFKSIKKGKTQVITDHIETFTERGLRLASGEELEADIIVTATGLNMQVMGGSAFSVDGRPVNFADTVSYKGMMYAEIPNLIQTFGYINASWTLRADLTAEYACRVINHMDRLGVRQYTRLRKKKMQICFCDPGSKTSQPVICNARWTCCPDRGDKDPWRNTQNYALDKKIIRKAPLEDGALLFAELELRPIECTAV